MRISLRAFQKILDEVNMKGNVLRVSLVALGLSAFLAVSAQHAAAQGPAGAGAAEAAKSSSISSHSLNPIKWVKKDKKAADANGSRADLEKRSEERRVGKECRSRWRPYH